MQGNSNQFYLISINMLNVQLEVKNILDHLYSTDRDVYKALPRPPFGKSHLFFLLFFFSPLFNQVGKLRTSSHLQLWPGQDKAKQFDTYNNTELHME